jgi:hypothetical protein
MRYSSAPAGSSFNDCRYAAAAQSQQITMEGKVHSRDEEGVPAYFYLFSSYHHLANLLANR